MAASAVRVAPRAQRDILEISDWLSDYSIALAERFIDAVQKAVQHLREYPESGRLRPEFGLRVLVREDWIIAYVFDGDNVEIARVLTDAEISWRFLDSRNSLASIIVAF